MYQLPDKTIIKMLPDSPGLIFDVKFQISIIKHESICDVSMYLYYVIYITRKVNVRFLILSVSCCIHMCNILNV